MSVWKKFRAAADGLKEDAWTVKRILSIRFMESTMNRAQQDAYDTLSKQLHYDVSQDGRSIPQKITVPANMREKDATVAIRRMKLECDPSQDFEIIWQARNGAKTVLREKSPQP